MTYEVAFVTIAAFVLAGISWNTLGIWQKWRNGASDASIDWIRVRKNVIIGIVLGIIAYGVKVSSGEPGVVVASVDDFVGTVITAFPLVVIADKIFNKTR